MKFDITQNKLSSYYTGNFNLSFNDEVILEDKKKEKVIDVISKVLEALL